MESKPEALRVLAVTLQVVLLTWAVYHFRLESRHLLSVLLLACCGFPLHAVLPERFRLRFFLLLSLAAIGIVLGPQHGAVLVAVGCGLIALCHLPVAWRWRYAALLSAGALLVLARARVIEVIRHETFWQILGSMFMFRLVLYLHELRHGRLAPAPVWSLSYFFLLPNVCFPLFPVVDYKRFRKTWYSEAAHRIYQRGAHWMLRGVSQLILYRFVYHYLTVSPVEVDGAGKLLLYTFSAFPLYLRVSGQFHLIVGMLLLFGFNLPETHHRYFLASSLTDFWRRINIYWKDFMTKIVFYPSYDRLRRLGPTKALVLATAVVFAATWLLHSYQWFWITGSWLLTWNDTLFWFLLGGLVIANVLYENRFGKKHSLGRRTPAAAERLARGMRTLCTFVVISVLWSLWTSDSLDQWLEVAAVAPAVWWGLAGWVTALFAGAFLVERAGRRWGSAGPARPAPAPGKAAGFSFWRDAGLTAAGALALLAVGAPAVYGRLGAPASEVVESLRFSGLNQRDAEARTRGYYEHLITANLRQAALAESYVWTPPDWQRMSETELWQPREDMLIGELRPQQSMVFKRAPLSTNRWGMRDRDYPRRKPAGTVRLAVLGSSHTMGSGVADGEAFESVYEERLGAATEGSFEVLSFAVAGYTVTQDLLVLESKALDFGPDVVLQVSHHWDVNQVGEYLATLLADGREVLPGLRDIAAAAGIDPQAPATANMRRLWPHRWEHLRWVYGRIVELCRQRGAVPVWVYLPLVQDGSPADVEAMTRLAAEVGFHVVDLRGVYRGYTAPELRLAPWDDHPNALGHRLIAERLLDALGPDELHRLMHAAP